jgi:glucokinase
MPLIECFDVGGTSIRGAIIEDEKILFQKTIPSTQEGFPALISLIKNLSNEIRAEAKRARVDYTVIGLPGPVQGDILLNSSPLGILSSESLKPLVHLFSNPVKIENDLKLAVKAEYFRGQGKGLDSFYVLTFSTGMGAGLVWNKNHVEGTMGEFGHIILDVQPNSPACVLNHRGCWFSFSSGKGIQSLSGKPSEDIFVLAQKGDAFAKSIIQKSRAANAHGIGTMLNAFAVEKIIVMGSIGLMQFSHIIPRAEEIAPFTIHPVPEIVPTSLGDDIGLWGAYYSGINE